LEWGFLFTTLLIILLEQPKEISMSHRAWAILFFGIIAACVADFAIYEFATLKFLMIKGDRLIEYLAFWR